MSQLELNSELDENFEERITWFADVILPIPLPGTYTYRIPRELEEYIQLGSRVVVQFGKKKILTGIVKLVHQNVPQVYEAKYVLDSLDHAPVVNSYQLDFFAWLSQYYMCTIGEVLNAALPSGLKLTSESLIQLNPETAIGDAEAYSEKELVVLEALKSSDRLSFDQVSDLLGVKMIHAVLKSLLQKESILLFEQVKDKFKPKTVKTVQLADQFIADESAMQMLFELLEKKPKQQAILLKYLSLIRIDEIKSGERTLLKTELLTEDLSVSSYKTLVKNGVFVENEKIISRLEEITKVWQASHPLSAEQEEAMGLIHKSFEQNKPVLLHGVTGSGKTEIYIDLIQQALENGGQVLYLLPEIALTTQIVSRLHKVFGGALGVYHSKYSDNERVEVWNGVNNSKINLVAGVRSSVFLPFSNLSLIIIDEEHESSYKQYEPAPRYHARDAAIWLSHLHQAHVLMGTATPSIDSYQNALDGKYELVELSQRFGTGQLPAFELANILTSRKSKRMKGDFTPELLEGIKQTLIDKEQVILFQNRRGYSPYLICHDCNHVPKCQSCDVSLTYHMGNNVLICHYCGHKESVPAICDACGSTAIRTVGFGTEKLEEDLKLLFPEAHIQRMDQDTTRSKYSYQHIIDRFERGETDILVGTQMLSKGLDFDKVSLVGIFDYDRIVHFPDFRSHERAFQLITQVSGRAGRKDDKGKVILQTGEPDEPLLYKIKTGDYKSFFQTEILERQNFQYPPFYRLIKIILKHKEKNILQQATQQYAKRLIGELGRQRVLGPQEPVISRIRNLYIEEIYIKVEKKKISISKVKELIYKLGLEVKQHKDYKMLRLYFDVDPV
ncbi:primosomal protein N' [Reichenbachiella carrageenanivorans]|uniref:Replication restart protein PriA n=1 Tax=Reichenbachiella carrageenanivorans TaxID=2979869 RepID=A0ABY6D1B7_9BACT|nr:primosomal protein N' [Reichenbachiella carrageenanivorans]UXX77660.1 primosomal protein N' [Reichenbachiella carrageenanivorans]